MRKSRFTDEQKIAVVQQAAAGAQVRELWRSHGITEQRFYRWRGKLDGLAGRRREACALEDENRRGIVIGFTPLAFNQWSELVTSR